MKKSLYASPIGKDAKQLLIKIIERFGHERFDFLLMVYDDSRFDDVIFSRCRIIYDKSPLFQQTKRILTSDICRDYEYIFFWMDDIDILSFNPENFLNIMRRYKIQVGQPALSHDSYISHPITKCTTSRIGRYTDFVEQMVPVYTAESWNRIWHLFSYDKYGWGWGYDLLTYSYGRLLRMAIIDAEVVKHTKAGDYHEKFCRKEMKMLFDEKWYHFCSRRVTIVGILNISFMNNVIVFMRLYLYKLFSIIISFARTDTKLIKG